MSFIFKDRFLKKPSNPTNYYLNISNILIVLSVIFFVFLVGYSWIQNPLKIFNSSEDILLPYLTIEVFGKLLSDTLDGFIFGLYRFVLDTINFVFFIFSKIAFFGVPVLVFISLLSGILSGVLGKNKLVLISYIAFVLAFIAGVFYLKAHVYFVFVLLGLVLNFSLLKFDNKNNGGSNDK